MKNVLRFFGLLDVLSIVMLSKQVFSVVMHMDQIPDQTLSKLRTALTIAIYLLLYISASGLLLLKKWGCVSYYIQFPFRLVVWIFSFGFLTLINEYTIADIFEWLFRLVIILEFLRLYFTAAAHRRFARL